MAVYVDELVVWPHAKHRCFKQGSSHLEADTLEELHAFARRLGLKREWFQPRSSPHYDLSPAKRELALLRGAKFRPAREWALEKACKRRRPDFEIAEVFTPLAPDVHYFIARWTHDGIAYELVGMPGVEKTSLLSACFREILCLDDDHKRARIAALEE